MTLNPCPFCGGKESFIERLDYSAAYVQCDSEVSPGVACMARGPVGMQESDDEDVPGSDAAVREWNRRAGEARLLDALKRCRFDSLNMSREDMEFITEAIQGEQK